MNEQLVAAIVALLVTAAGWLKSHTEVNAVKRDRETTKTERDTEIAVRKSKVGDLEKYTTRANIPVQFVCLGN